MNNVFVYDYFFIWLFSFVNFLLIYGFYGKVNHYVDPKKARMNISSNSNVDKRIQKILNPIRSLLEKVQICGEFFVLYVRSLRVFSFIHRNARPILNRLLIDY